MLRKPGLPGTFGGWRKLDGRAIRCEKDGTCGVLDYFSMRKFIVAIFVFALSCSALAGWGFAQAVGKTPVRAPVSVATVDAERGVGLAQRGLCVQALPLLVNALPHLTVKRLRYDAALARARCGMSLDRMQDAVGGLVLLNREFPRDPQVLYITTHYFSELANRAAHTLAITAPTSAQAMELEAEGLESEKKWNEAAKEYRRILAKYPNMVGIHYRIGRLLLNGLPTAAEKEEAKKEFEEELKVDPHSAATEFMLGDLAWESQQWDEAIQHFGMASKDDAGFSEAFLGLGVALNAAGKYAEAIAPLEKYVKMDPGDPAGHYQLAIAYARTGRKQDADRQMALQQEAATKRRQQKPQSPSTPH